MAELTRSVFEYRRQLRADSAVGDYERRHGDGVVDNNSSKRRSRLIEIAFNLTSGRLRGPFLPRSPTPIVPPTSPFTHTRGRRFGRLYPRDKDDRPIVSTCCRR